MGNLNNKFNRIIGRILSKIKDLNNYFIIRLKKNFKNV